MTELRRSRWRLTLTVWSLVLAAWAVLTISLDYEALVLIRRLVGEHGFAPILALAAVIVLPVLIDAARNLPRYRRRWLERARRLETLDRWSAAVPSTTPRVFRLAPGATLGELTWREKSIVEQGQLAIGQIEQHGALTSVRYEAPWGDVIASRPVAARGTTPRPGMRAPLLFEPGAHVGVAPTLLGLSFAVTPPTDQRTLLAPAHTAAPPSHPTPRHALRVPAFATLHPIERMSRYLSADVGELSLVGPKLTLTLGENTSSVSLDKPFRVELAVHLLAAGLAEVTVHVEPRASGAYRAGSLAGVRFKTELPQKRLGARLPTAWIDACYLQPSDFDTLWAAIVARADDAELTASVALA